MKNNYFYGIISLFNLFFIFMNETVNFLIVQIICTFPMWFPQLIILFKNHFCIAQIGAYQI